MDEDQIIASLAPLMSEARIRRIDEVLASRLGSVVVVLDNLHDEHNVSAIARTCEGLGVGELHIIESSQRIKMRRRVTQSSHLWMDIIRHQENEACLRALQARGFRLYGACASLGGEQGQKGNGERPDEVPIDAPLALIFGAEHFGLSSETKALLDGTFEIPMYGFSRSFNVSVAAGIAVHSATSRIRDRRQAAGDLTPSQQKTLRARFYQLSVRGAEMILASPRLTPASPTATRSPLSISDGEGTE